VGAKFAFAVHELWKADYPEPRKETHASVPHFLDLDFGEHVYGGG
jgi:hypothetical protein